MTDFVLDALLVVALSAAMVFTLTVCWLGYEDWLLARDLKRAEKKRRGEW